MNKNNEIKNCFVKFFFNTILFSLYHSRIPLEDKKAERYLMTTVGMKRMREDSPQTNFRGNTISPETVLVEITL